MGHHRESRRRGRHRHPDREHRRSRVSGWRKSETAEERAYRQARSRANRRIGVAIHQIAYASVLILIAITTRSVRVVLIVAAAWGVGLAMHHFAALSIPRLRRRWVEEEVGRHVERGVVREHRRELEGRHVRSLGALSAEVAHEIRNPIAAARSLVQQMGEDPASSGNIESADVALRELDRVERSISHLLKYAREEELQLEIVDVVEVLDSAIDTFRDRLERMGVRVERDVAATGILRADPEKLRRVLINLIANALDAMEQAKVAQPVLEVRAGENLAGSEVWVRIRDNGPGIDAETIERIFSPFYTTKSSGTGLGLALSRKMVDAHGGSIEAKSTPGQGTEFILSFPCPSGTEEASR